jgi:hypothetical protein
MKYRKYRDAMQISRIFDVVYPCLPGRKIRRDLSRTTRVHPPRFFRKDDAGYRLADTIDAGPAFMDRVRALLRER